MLLDRESESASQQVDLLSKQEHLLRHTEMGCCTLDNVLSIKLCSNKAKIENATLLLCINKVYFKKTMRENISKSKSKEELQLKYSLDQSYCIYVFNV